MVQQGRQQMFLKLRVRISTLLAAKAKHIAGQVSTGGQECQMGPVMLSGSCMTHIVTTALLPLLRSQRRRIHAGFQHSQLGLHAGGHWFGSAHSDMQTCVQACERKVQSAEEPVNKQCTVNTRQLTKSLKPVNKRSTVSPGPSQEVASWVTHRSMYACMQAPRREVERGMELGPG